MQVAAERQTNAVPGTRHRIVVVGGGAGGIELATQLGDTLGRRDRAHITLVDESLTHVWKPLLHEIAAGTLDSHDDDLDYLAQAHWHHFNFRFGRMQGLDRARREVVLAPLLDNSGHEIVPARRLPFDTLVIAVGSVSNDFNVPGARQHCLFLDTRAQADAFHQHLLQAFLRAQARPGSFDPGALTIAIVGGGATGVELAAELRESARQLFRYGLDRFNPEHDVRLALVQARERLLPELPPRLSNAIALHLQQLGVRVYTGERVVRVTREALHTESGLTLPAAFKVWAGGIKAPEFLRDLDGLEVNAIHQLVVRPTLQTTRDDAIFAFGDCGACPQKNGLTVPPRAQAAHQQARFLVKALARRLRGARLSAYTYKDYGSLISLGRHTSLGNLMGNLTGNVMIEGRLARLMYLSLEKLHQRVLHGTLRVALVTLANLLTRPTRPRLKLH